MDMRIYQIKHYAMFFLTIYFIACKDNPTIQNNSEISQKIEGNIASYNLGSNVTLKMELIYRLTSTGQIDSIITICTCDVDSTGHFNLMLAPPPNILLRPINWINVRFYYSDTSARFFMYPSFFLYKNDFRINGIYCSEKSVKVDPYGGYYKVDFLYCTKDVSVVGQDTSWHGNLIVTYRINYHLKAGWNQIIWQRTSVTDTLVQTDRFVDNNFKGNWFLYYR